MDKKSFIAIMGYLIYRVAANLACVQMVQNFQLFVQIQLVVEQQYQILKTACVHNKLSDLC